jgi:hypothetical protein
MWVIGNVCSIILYTKLLTTAYHGNFLVQVVGVEILVVTRFIFLTAILPYH